MLNLLHTFLNFIELNNSLNLNNILLNNNKVKNKLNIDENLKLFLKNKKSIGSKDRKLFTNIFYTYFKHFKLIEHLTINSYNSFIESEIGKIYSEKFIILNDNQENNKDFKLFIRFYISIELLNAKSNEIKDLENKYDFFDHNKYYKLILSKILNFEEELIFKTIEVIEMIINNNVNQLNDDIDNICSIKAFNSEIFDNYIDLLSIKYSFLDFNIVELIKSSLDANNRDEILDKLNNLDNNSLIKFNDFINSNLNNLNSRANLYIRVISNEKFILDDFEKSNISYNKTILPTAFQIENNSSLSNLDSFKKGLFEIQDLSSQMIFQFVKTFFEEYKIDDYNYSILDYCAGGGGKSLLFADELNLMNVNYNIIATDNNSKRLVGLKERLNKNIKINRNIKIVNNADFDKNRNTYKDKFDLIIIDAPCSGFGTVKRSPDNKYKYSLSDLNEFSNLQTKIIEECLPLLIVGGIIIYITCSLNYIENSNNINKIESKSKSIKVLENFSISSDIIKNQKYFNIYSELKIKNQKGITIYPTEFESDGFYMCLIKNQNN